MTEPTIELKLREFQRLVQRSHENIATKKALIAVAASYIMGALSTFLFFK